MNSPHAWQAAQAPRDIAGGASFAIIKSGAPKTRTGVGSEQKSQTSCAAILISGIVAPALASRCRAVERRESGPLPRPHALDDCVYRPAGAFLVCPVGRGSPSAVTA